MTKSTRSVRKTQAIFFPFALFGSGGTAAGAEALADAVQEMLEDNKREKKPSRAAAYSGRIRTEEFTFAELADYNDWRERARKTVRRILDSGDFLFWVTGNHLGALPIYDQLAARPNTLIVQFDAHLDVYNLSDCTEQLSHGNYLLHCAGKLPPIVNVGHRDLFLPSGHVSKYFQQTFSAADLAIDAQPALAHVHEATHAASGVFIDIDCDVFDPAFFPAVAHPLPFGMSPHLLLRFLHAIWSPRVLGVAISEFEPARDRHDQSLGTLLWLVEYLLLRMYEQGFCSAAF